MISNVAKSLLEKYRTSVDASYDIHFTDDLFKGAQFFLNFSDGKISNIFYIPGENSELDALVLSSLELSRRIGVKYFIMANFREVENFLRDDATKFAWERVLAHKEAWEASQVVLLRGFIYSLLLKSGLDFVSFPSRYEDRVTLITKQILHVNSVLANASIGSVKIVALEDTSLYCHYELLPGQTNTLDLSLALLDGVSEYLNFCYGSNSIKLVAQ